MHMITRSGVLLLWSQLMTFVTCQDCTLEQFKKSRHFDLNFDISGLQATYSGGKQVRVPCNPGYTGFFKMICSEGRWLSSSPKCEVKSCGHPGDAQFADFRLVVGDDYVVGSEIVYECNPGYHMVSRSSHRRCLPEGWDGNIPVCEATKCPAIHADNNVQILGDAEEATSGNVVRFSCKSSAEILDGSQEIYCKADGEWSGPVPKCKAIRCSVPHIEHGRVRGAAQEYKEQEILDFTCDPSYKRANDRTPRCTKFAGKGDWSPTPACILIKCELPLASIPGTTYNPPYKNLFSPGEKVRVSCGEKYWILDTKTTVADFTCGINGNWNTDIVCQEVTCPQYIQEEHLNYAVDAWGRTKLGDRVRYSCDRNSDPGSSDGMATCTRDGWTPKPLCRGRQCAKPNIENSRITSNNRKIYSDGDRLTYQCVRGNQKPVTITCNRGAWKGIQQCPDEPRCQKPEITNGFAVEPRPGTIYYACNENFKLPTKGWWGHAKCKDGGFGQLPSCIAKTMCGDPPAISNGKVTVSGTIGRIECNKGYIGEIPELTCVNGSWNSGDFGPKTICRATPENCGPPPKVENAIVNVPYREKYSDGFTVTYQCRHKYIMQEEATITCRTGTWEKRNITCVPSCEQLNDTRLRVTTDTIKETYLAGDVVQYECTAPGANRQGSATCENGKWTKSEECPGIPCEVDTLGVGLVYLGSAPRNNRVMPGEKFRFLCGDEYDMEGSDEVQCLDTGKWNPPFPTCSEKCRIPELLKTVRIVSSVQGDFISKGDILSFACRQQDHIMQGNSTSSCLGNGKWSNPLPQCAVHILSAAVHCSAPPTLEDGDTKLFISSATVYQTGDRIEYICVDKYTMYGDPFKTCDNGVWKGDMRCLKPCTVNEELMRQHGIIFRHGSDNKMYAPHEDHLTFRCVSRKSLVGTVPFRVQCNDGQMTLPTCQ
ncbi:complement factor H-like isoform X3 [Gambusia affinis]|uniref:complement factor H-like isoform X3 n=1 Tax=Gambusia affinis TaxID=33528 RepID=UPI001CDC502C|nr:complement factor H-like isoform X3 [Gambusia affinis]